MAGIRGGFEWLAGPAALGVAYTGGKFKLPPHLAYLNKELLHVAAHPGSRLMVNMPFGMGKSQLSSRYFVAWLMLVSPETRVMLVAHEQEFADKFGAEVKEVIDRFGPQLGLELSPDTKAKGEWKLKGHEGGMVCRGPESGVIGRHCEIFVVDDLVKNWKQALSPTVMESHRKFYESVVFSRLRKNTSVVIVMTRWVKNDVCGHILKTAKGTTEQWRHVKFAALAKEGDVLGRKVGEPLWPEQVPLENLLRAQRVGGMTWHASYQQEPLEEEGLYFHPLAWPKYRDLGLHFSVEDEYGGRKLVAKEAVTRVLAVDWAWSKKKTADFTALVTFGLLPDGRCLVLDAVNKRLRLEELAPAIASACRTHRPRAVVIEKGHPTVSGEVRSYPEIPECRFVSPGSENKLQRALPAMMMDGNKRLLLPAAPEPWKDEYVDQLSGFTGLDDDHDDLVDATGMACELARQLRGMGGGPLTDKNGPCQLTPGRENWEWGVGG